MYLPDVLREVDAECRRREIPMLGPEKAARLVELLHEARPGLVIEVGTAAITYRSLGSPRPVMI
jgi:predicted O-methyltransferase YrrM